MERDLSGETDCTMEKTRMFPHSLLKAVEKIMTRQHEQISEAELILTAARVEGEKKMVWLQTIWFIETGVVKINLAALPIEVKHELEDLHDALALNQQHGPFCPFIRNLYHGASWLPDEK